VEVAVAITEKLIIFLMPRESTFINLLKTSTLQSDVDGNKIFRPKKSKTKSHASD
jgi:hypothetical protein